MDISEEDYQKAVAVVRKCLSGSVSNLQRKLYWGYGRAASAIDRMQDEFIVSPMSASGRRDVYPEETHDLWKKLQAAKAQAVPDLGELQERIAGHQYYHDEHGHMVVDMGDVVKEISGFDSWKAQAVPEGFVLISAEQLSQWGYMANCAEEYGCPECFEARGYAHSLACEINEFFAIEAQEQK